MEVNVLAINRFRRLALLEGDRMVEFHSIHDADGDEVDNVEEATFAVLKLADDCWVNVMFADFEEGSTVH